jgi:23S rRNA (cytosine1962-C5)-methyltransferase
MDPPSYGRGPNGEIWKLEENFYDFVALTEKVLSDNPLFVIINSYTKGLATGVLKYVADDVFTKKYGGTSEADELGLFVSDSNGYLPAGAAVRWRNK